MEGLIAGTTLALNNMNWLDAQTTGGFVPTTSTGVLTTNCYQPWEPYNWNYWNGYTYVTTISDARPIKLTLSEIERLRKAAKADDKLKAILAKFTSQIEITVDFE